MCGIVGYVGERNSLDVLMAGLSRLEYRGYDSAGVAIVDDDGVLETAKRAGKLQVLAGDLERARCTTAAPASATRGGRPTAAPPIATRTRTSATTDDSRHPQRHHRELRRAEGRAPRRGLRVRERDRHRGRRRAARPRVPSRRRAHRGVPRHRVAPRRGVHPARRPRPTRRRGRRLPQLAARHRAGRGRELPGVGCRRVRRVHEARRGDRPRPDRRSRPKA